MTNRKTATECTAEAIRDYILENELKEGDRLPSEQQMCIQFGTSRNILREAIQQFREAGIIVSKTKTGAMIQSLKPTNPYRPFFPFLAKDQKALRELMQMRIALEIGFIPYIIAGKTAKKIAGLEVACNQYENATTTRQRTEAEQKFHTRLLRFANNSILESLLPLIIDFFEGIPVSEKERRSSKKIAAEHRMIVEALRSGNEAELLKAIKKHSENYLS